MITSWEDFEKRRASSLEYHKHNSEHEYTHALTYFEYVRRYFDAKGFPTMPKGKRKWTVKDGIEQRKEIQAWIRKVIK